MSCLNDLPQIEKSLIGKLTQLEHATRLLRGLCDAGYLKSRCPSCLTKLWTAALCLLGESGRTLRAPSLSVVMDSDRTRKPDKAEWIQRYLRFVGKLNSPEANAIGYLWEQRARGVEQFLRDSVPPEFVKAVGEGKEEFRKVWAIWFRPTTSEATKLYFETPNELKHLNKIGGWRKYRHAGTRWDSVRNLLKDEKWRANWPSVATAIGKVSKACRQFEILGTTDFYPTVAQLKDVAVSIVTEQLNPWVQQDGQPIEKQSELLIRQRLLARPDVLAPQLLMDAIRCEFDPCFLDHKDIKEALAKCVHAGRLRLIKIESQAYFVLGRNESAAGRPVKTRYHPSRNDTIILKTIDAAHVLISQTDIETASTGHGGRVHRHTVGKCLAEMESAKLVDRPNGPQSGYKLLPKGLELLESLTAGRQ